MTTEEYINNSEGDNHIPLLWFCLELTKNNKLPVGEFGAGNGSTYFLRQYCKETKRDFYSYDNDRDWGNKWGSQVIDDWNNSELYKPSSTVLIDQAPGESRRISIELLKDMAEIIVVHDAEPHNSNSYKLDEIYHLFKYRIYTKGEKIWTVALSNYIDLCQYDKTIIHKFQIEL